MESRPPHRTVLVGGGFGGLYFAKALADPRFELTLVDRRNFHLFQPLLYQVATGGLSPADIAAPLRSLLKGHRNATVLLGEAVDVDVDARKVILAAGAVEYDSLILAAGARHHYFGNDSWESLAPGLKTVEDATEMRSRILRAFELAEEEPEPEKRRELLTFVIVGGGPTGVELAGTLGELARQTLRGEFRRFDPEEARVILVEGSSTVLSHMQAPLPARALASLGKLGVTVLLGSKVVELRPGEATVEMGGRREVIRAATVLWAAGVKASPLGAALASRAGATLDRAGRVVVDPDFSVPGHPEIFVIGDMASYSHATGSPLPGVAPVAMQEGRHVAKVLRSRLDGEEPPRFRYRDKGDLATIGRAAAVGKVGKFKFSGFPAWLIWLFVHILYLAGFENRVLVLFQWAWNYFTRNRSARLITHPK